MSQIEAISDDIRSIQPARQGRELDASKDQVENPVSAEHTETRQDKPDIGDIDSWEPQHRVVLVAMPDSSRLRMIARALDRRDSTQSKLLLQMFREQLERSGDEAVWASLGALTLRYDKLVAHESRHGKSLLLDHRLSEILRYQRQSYEKHMTERQPPFEIVPD